MGKDRAATLNVRPLVIADLKPHPANYNRHTEGQLAELVKSIRRHGAYKNAVVSADGYILAGHGILEAARMDGWKQWPCEVRDYNHDHPDALNLLLTDNEVGNPANPLGPDPDQALLAALAQQVSEATGLEGTGLDDARLAELLAATEEAPPELEDPGPGEPPKEPVTKPGDVWLMRSAQGMEHRVGCCDATEAKAVSAVLSGASPILCVTDPPYGVDYDPEWRDGVDKKGLLGNRPSVAVGKVTNDDRCEWSDALDLFTGDVLYLWHGGLKAGEVSVSLKAGGWVPVCHIVWRKPQGVFGRGDYHWQHEECWYAVRKGKTHNWQGARDQTTVWDIAGMSPFGRSSDEADKTTGHGTQKPVECMARPMRNNTAPGQGVYDPFLGSGTSLIAAESIGRVCYGMDVSPQWVDCAVLRWMRATKQPAILESTGERFPMPEEA